MLLSCCAELRVASVIELVEMPDANERLCHCTAHFDRFSVRCSQLHTPNFKLIKKSLAIGEGRAHFGPTVFYPAVGERLVHCSIYLSANNGEYPLRSRLSHFEIGDRLKHLYFNKAEGESQRFEFSYQKIHLPSKKEKIVTKKVPSKSKEARLSSFSLTTKEGRLLSVPRKFLQLAQLPL